MQKYISIFRAVYDVRFFFQHFQVYFHINLCTVANWKGFLKIVNEEAEVWEGKAVYAKRWGRRKAEKWNEEGYFQVLSHLSIICSDMTLSVAVVTEHEVSCQSIQLLHISLGSRKTLTAVKMMGNTLQLIGKDTYPHCSTLPHTRACWSGN